jgi:hypothetical protein
MPRRQAIAADNASNTTPATAIHDVTLILTLMLRPPGP